MVFLRLDSDADKAEYRTMQTLSPTKARSNLTFWLKAAACGEDVGILFGDQIIALNIIFPVKPSALLPSHSLTLRPTFGCSFSCLKWRSIVDKPNKSSLICVNLRNLIRKLTLWAAIQAVYLPPLDCGLIFPKLRCE